jgi:hypothetical protein
MSENRPTRSSLLQQSASEERLANQLPLTREPYDFSLVLGGPLFQLWRRTHLSGNALELLHRRILVMTLLAWVPLAVFSIAEGRAWGTSAQVPFFYDIGLHARLLVGLPLLIAAELFVYRRMRHMVLAFLDDRLIPEADRPRFDAAIASALRLRNSTTAEIVLIALVYVVGVGLIWRTQLAFTVPSWYGAPVNGTLQPSLAGWWLGLVSLPMFQFLLVRWYYRFFIWTRFLWQVSRIRLHIVPTHPDRCGGLGFLTLVCYAFAPLLLAQGVVLSGMMADRIFYEGASLLQFKLDIVALVVAMVLAVLGPTLVFTPQLLIAKQDGMLEYGTLAERYVREFDQKWMRGRAPPHEPLIGNPDIRSLADMAKSFEVVEEMRLVPFNLHTTLQLAAITFLPMLPLTLTLLSAEELLDKVVHLFV